MNQVLIADDSKSIRLSLRSLLEEAGFVVSETQNGAECLDAARRGDFNLIITDLDMPVMDGFTLCRELKKDPTTQTIPIIIFSSLDSEERVAAGFRLGAWAFVSKSTPDDLELCLRTWLDRHQGRHGLKVLVVDDSPVILESITQELSCDGYHVRPASDGEDALRQLGDGYRPDIIVSDLYMPRVDGFGLLSQLRRHPELNNIPVVIMSSNPDRAAIMKAIQAGAASYLTKPFGSGQLAVHLDRILSDQFQILNETRKRLEREQELFVAAMSSLVNALEAKDQYTRGHSEAVAEMSALIGSQMGLDDTSLERLHLAGRLHDLGKIGIRDSVLQKAGTLSKEEFAHIKTHTIIVESILSPIPSVQDLVEAACSHHEHWDGTGYPKGLAGEDIPLFGRIIAVADVYDALTSDRSYRSRMSSVEAIKVIRDGIGRHFCPQTGQAFLSIMHDEAAGR
jgi:response regulator RpfG family c-di-GMP phosphodiesterase